MSAIPRAFGAMVLVFCIGLASHAQQASKTASPTKAAPNSIDATAVAARVNNQVISEIALQRGLKRIPADKQDQARPEILDYLIENLLIDQYLQQLGEKVDKKEVDAKVKLIHEEIERKHEDYAKVMKELMLTDTELRTNIEAELRWNAYAEKQATDDQLKKLFSSDKEMFDGTMVRARHILRSSGKESDRVKAGLLQVKKQIEDQVTQGLSKLPADTSKLNREKARQELLEKAFSDVARKESECPATKDMGGDLQWFPRGGSMVEPFAKAAFSLPPFQISDVVQTQFGYHLILVTDRKPGREVVFDEVKDEVKEVYFGQLRDRLIARVRPTAKITITPVGKTAGMKEEAKSDSGRN
ncbi:MAG TPA: peptidylprolyl isomerase [Gemmataceae bacterium]|nr:peptidylprolyl isomerase [Gemmataceae bacterium]